MLGRPEGEEGARGYEVGRSGMRLRLEWTLDWGLSVTRISDTQQTHVATASGLIPLPRAATLPSPRPLDIPSSSIRDARHTLESRHRRETPLTRRNVIIEEKKKVLSAHRAAAAAASA
jgi:hypothetical protein